VVCFRVKNKKLYEYNDVTEDVSWIDLFHFPLQLFPPPPLPPLFPYIALHLSRVLVVMNFAAKKHFGLVDIGQIGLDIIYKSRQRVGSFRHHLLNSFCGLSME
jgi:hypothetical protein